MQNLLVQSKTKREVLQMNRERQHAQVERFSEAHEAFYGYGESCGFTGKELLNFTDTDVEYYQFMARRKQNLETQTSKLVSLTKTKLKGMETARFIGLLEKTGDGKIIKEY